MSRRSLRDGRAHTPPPLELKRELHDAEGAARHGSAAVHVRQQRRGAADQHQHERCRAVASPVSTAAKLALPRQHDGNVGARCGGGVQLRRRVTAAATAAAAVTALAKRVPGCAAATADAAAVRLTSTPCDEAHVTNPQKVTDSTVLAEVLVSFCKYLDVSEVPACSYSYSSRTGCFADAALRQQAVETEKASAAHSAAAVLATEMAHKLTVKRKLKRQRRVTYTLGPLISKC
ncbi:hypothetical protein JKP88DRAFT_246829 [Tribonema minus]|uniref:Uncharacterized protein n=1 Tax=Tribonema minus TaxID=303371 RepID=A0A836CE06_9STRA|nr:hypothetical protein JKP88DRAFT_246829 [Tribonema minus]